MSSTQIADGLNGSVALVKNIMTFREFALTRHWDLTTDEEICGELLIKFIAKNPITERFFSQLGTGTTTMLMLLESYFKYDNHRTINQKETSNG